VLDFPLGAMLVVAVDRNRNGLPVDDLFRPQIAEADYELALAGLRAAQMEEGIGVLERAYKDWYDSQDLAYETIPFDGRSDYDAFTEVGIPAGGIFAGAEVIKTPAQVALYPSRQRERPGRALPLRPDDDYPRPSFEASSSFAPGTSDESPRRRRSY
jgi:hypothetical protein